MPTIYEFYKGDFPSTLSSGFDWTFSTADGSSPPRTVSARLHWDETAHSRFISYFVPRDASGDSDLLGQLLNLVPQAIEKADSNVSVMMSHPVWNPEGTDFRSVPFSGRVFLYVDTIVPPDIEQGLKRVAARVGLQVQIRDHRYAEFQTSSAKPKAFISHDSRNKASVARPLALELQRMLCPVWYDEFSLKPGDSLREGIDRGLSECPKCLVILSHQFMTNPGWGKAEFNAIVNRHFSEGGNVLIPIWHRVSAKTVREYSPLVADIVALNTKVGMQELARQVFNAVK